VLAVIASNGLKLGQIYSMLEDQTKESINQHSSWRFSCYWVVLLSIIAIALTLLPILFAKDLAERMIFGWPAPFLLVAFGLPLLYLLIVGLYAWLMHAREQTES
jgi:putative solute:sodium symporter small subunit